MNTKNITAGEMASQFDEEMAKILCTERLSTNDGGEITPQDATLAINAFNTLHPNDSVKAFHIGLETLSIMLEKAKTYNAQPGTQDSIIGFRFYRAVTSRIFGSFQVNNKYDLVIYPTLETDLDLSSGTLYSYSRPCPKLCAK